MYDAEVSLGQRPGTDRDMTDHELLVRIDERVNKIDRCLSNHLAHHWALTLAVGTALVGAVVTILFMTIGT